MIPKTVERNLRPRRRGKMFQASYIYLLQEYIDHLIIYLIKMLPCFCEQSP